MSSSTINGLIGVLLFATGLIALHAVISPQPAEDVPPAPETSVSIAGIGPAVQRMLLGAGRAEVLGAEAMSQIPPQVALALIENGVVLTIPAAGDR